MPLLLKNFKWAFYKNFGRLTYFMERERLDFLPLFFSLSICATVSLRVYNAVQRRKASFVRSENVAFCAQILRTPKFMTESRIARLNFSRRFFGLLLLFQRVMIHEIFFLVYDVFSGVYATATGLLLYSMGRILDIRFEIEDWRAIYFYFRFVHRELKVGFIFYFGDFLLTFFLKLYKTSLQKFVCIEFFSFNFALIVVRSINTFCALTG